MEFLGLAVPSPRVSPLETSARTELLHENTPTAEPRTTVDTIVRNADVGFAVNAADPNARRAASVLATTAEKEARRLGRFAQKSGSLSVLVRSFGMARTAVKMRECIGEIPSAILANLEATTWIALRSAEVNPLKRAEYHERYSAFEHSKNPIVNALAQATHRDEAGELRSFIDFSSADLAATAADLEAELQENPAPWAHEFTEDRKELAELHYDMMNLSTGEARELHRAKAHRYAGPGQREIYQHSRPSTSESAENVRFAFPPTRARPEVAPAGWWPSKRARTAATADIVVPPAACVVDDELSHWLQHRAN